MTLQELRKIIIFEPVLSSVAVAQLKEASDFQVLLMGPVLMILNDKNSGNVTLLGNVNR